MGVTMKFVVTFFVCVLASSCRPIAKSSLKEAPNVYNEPEIFDLKPQKLEPGHFKSRVAQLPWAGSHWFYAQDSILRKWKLSANSTIDSLSPAEKYDLWKGLKGERSLAFRVRKEIETAGGGNQLLWWIGICNGWSEAAQFEKAPELSVDVKNAAGQTIRFYRDDIAALASQFYFDARSSVQLQVKVLGARCGFPSHPGRFKEHEDSCKDTNPAPFHMALTQMIAAGQTMSADVDNGEAVLNQPVVGYDLIVGRIENATPANSENAARGTAFVANVTGQMEYVSAIEPAEGDRPLASLASKTEFLKLSYRLELNKDKIIIGGEWDKTSNFPDFLWTLGRPLMDADNPKSIIKIADVRELLDKSSTTHRPASHSRFSK